MLQKPKTLTVCAACIIFKFLVLVSFAATVVKAAPQHGIAMYGTAELEADFPSLQYANPDAPRGGKVVFGASGSFDSLNPWIVKGRAPWVLRSLVFEPLMGRNWDEPFSLYGLLAESIETDEQRNYVEFTLRDTARFSDGSPVTVEDVIWSFEVLGTQGHPRYRTAWSKIDSVEQTGERSVRFDFKVADRELPLILGLRPILRKADWEGRDFSASTMDVPTGSGPYLLDDFEPGRYLTLRRNPNYWGNDLGLNRGRHNFAELRYEYFGDSGIVFEAFKAGEIDIYREWNAGKWENQYDFPAVMEGQIVKSVIPHGRPSGIRGFVFNTRRDLFRDWRVRDALIHAFNFEFINNTLNDGKQPRIQSYFSNSALGMQTGPAEGKVRSLLERHRNELLPGALDGYSLPKSDGSERNRVNIRKALSRFSEAGWFVDANGVMRNEQGKEFTFEILLAQGANETQAIANIFSEALLRLGISPAITVIDSAQYKERTNRFDFDMTWYSRAMSLSPGNEQYLYWGRDSVNDEGSRNWMGVASDAIDDMISTMLSSTKQDDFLAAVRGLDRILTTGRYVIPVWYSDHSRIAHRKELKYPDSLPVYGDWIGFLPDVWWYEE